MFILSITIPTRLGFTSRKEDEVFERFKEFKALLENLSEKKIKTLRSDNGGEFTSNEFKDFVKEDGMKKELTIPYNPK